ncbi:MAG: LytTR family DNA-binding domain-containing protein [Pseudoflavonifractor sp.]
MNSLILCTAAVDANQVLQDYCTRNPHSAVTTELCSSNQQLLALLLQNRRQQAELSEPFFTVKTTSGPRLCPLSDIVYCQSDAHRYRVYLADGNVLVSTNGRCRFFETMEPLLGDKRFLPCGRSIIINTGYIAQVDRSLVTLYNGITLTMPTHRQAEFRAALSACKIRGI